MLVVLLKYKKFIITSVFFFYLGCLLTFMILSRVNCLEKDAPQLYHALAPEGSTVLPVSQAEYVVLVLSSPKNGEVRDNIRRTWGRLVYNIVFRSGGSGYQWNPNKILPVKKNFVTVLFVVGTQGLTRDAKQDLQSEASRFADLLLLDNMKDGYHLLADKLIQSLAWLDTNIPDLKYVIKVDDDSFVRVDLIVDELLTYGLDIYSKKKMAVQIKGLYWGYFKGNARVKKTGKWMENNWFLCDTYLPYALGGGYVISRSIVSYITKNADFLTRYKSEDVSMGVWTAALSNINRAHDSRFDTEWRSRGCLHSLLVRHKQSTQDMQAMYDNLVKSDGVKLCSTETHYNAYIYNWDVSPLECCV